VEATPDSPVMFLPVAAFAALLQSEESVARAVVDHLGKTLMSHSHSNLNEFEMDLIVNSKVPATLKFMQLLCRLLRKANLAVASRDM
jgi:CRP-like cAMP-binding protein